MTDETMTDEPEVDEEEPTREPEDQMRRIERLRRSLLAVDRADLRRGMLALPAPVLDEVAKAVRVRVPVLRAGTTGVLRRLQDPLLLDAVAGAVDDDCMDAVRDRLGDQADDPEEAALVEVVDALTGTDYSVAMMRLTLAMVAAGLAEAADKCDGILDRDDRFALPAEDAEPPEAAMQFARPVDTGPSEEKKAARKARKAEEAERRRAQQAKHAAVAADRKADHRKSAASTDADDESDDAPTESFSAGNADSPVTNAAPATPALLVTRRRPALTSVDAGRYDTLDPLVGSVVIAEVPFEEHDPEEAKLDRKWRPCVVIGVSATELLVRPGYSEGGLKTRTFKSYPLRDWRVANLHERTWVESGARRIPIHLVGDTVGQLSDEDWNALW